MKIFTRCWQNVMLAFVGLLAAHAQAKSTRPLEKLSWLTGCWQSVGAELGSGEQWSVAAGGTMLGMSRTVVKGKTVFFEFLQIRENQSGLEFVAQPNGAAPTVFALQRQTNIEVSFAAPEHDFPQIVSYRLVKPGQLAARIEGKENGVAKAVDFPLQRIACPK